jgi:hypothetical protein
MKESSADRYENKLRDEVESKTDINKYIEKDNVYDNQSVNSDDNDSDNDEEDGSDKKLLRSVSELLTKKTGFNYVDPSSNYDIKAIHSKRSLAAVLKNLTDKVNSTSQYSSEYKEVGH